MTEIRKELVWVPMAERAPEPGHEYLCTTTHSKNSSGFVVVRRFAHYWGGGWTDEDISHWAEVPLP